MLREDQTCPKCGALVTPQLTRCRQCGHYLHGTQLEGFLVENLLPKSLSGAPGTGLIALFAMLTYVLMLLLTGPEALAGFRPLALLQLGATTSTEIQDLELWRFVSSVFAHGSMLHIVFNLYALSIVGPLVERLYDRKRVIVFFVLTGTLSMLGSYLFRVWLMDAPFFAGSVGASGAISGLIGIAWVATRRLTSEGRAAHSLMSRWAVLLVAWGFVPGIDGVAHAAGLLVGALIGRLVPEGPPPTRWHHRVSTAATVAALMVVVSSSALTLVYAKDQPYRLEADAVPRRLLFVSLEPGAPWKASGQYAALQECLRTAKSASISDRLDEAIGACELAVRAVPASEYAHRQLALLLSEAGRSGAAARHLWIARRLSYL